MACEELKFGYSKNYNPMLMGLLKYKAWYDNTCLD